MPRKIPRPCAVSRLLDLHLGKGSKPTRQSLHNRGSRRRDQFRLQPGRIHRRIPEQFHGRGSRHRKRSMRAFHHPAADIQRRAHNLIHSQRLRSHRRANNIDQSVHRTHFVKVHALDGSVMNLRLRRPQRLKHRNRSLLRRGRNQSRRNNPTNLRQPASMRVFLWRGHSLRQAQGRLCPRTLTWKGMRMPTLRMFMLIPVGMFTVLMRMLMLMLPEPLPILLPRQILLSLHPHIHLRRRNSTPQHPRDLQPRPHSERSHGLFQHPSRNPGIHERAQKHVAAHAGKTLKVGNAHRKNYFTTEPQRHRENRKPKISFFSVPLCLCAASVFFPSFHHREPGILRQTSARRVLCYNHYLLQHFRGTPCIAIFSVGWPKRSAVFCTALTASNSTISSSSSRRKWNSASTLCHSPSSWRRNCASLHARLRKKLSPASAPSKASTNSK